jgi:phosphatidylglycerophosphatase A
LTSILAASCVLAIKYGGWAESYWKRKDPRHFVLDEFASFFLTVLIFETPNPFVTAFWAFFATRVLDILKPPPIKRLEQLPDGWGMLLDDLAAAIYAGLLLKLSAYLFPDLFFL